MSANLGKISLTIGGNHVISNTYERLTIVKSSTDVWYLSLWDVPANIPLTDQGYWVVFFDPAMNSQQVADNAQNIIGILDNISNINSALAGKADASHTHNYVPTSDVTQTVSGSKIVRRDSAGDVAARLFRPTYTSEARNSTFVVVQHARGTWDNYMRTRSLSNFASDVGANMYTFRSAWINLTKYNGWTGTCRYRKTKDETVLLEAVVKNTSGSSGYSLRHIATLPAGYRPETTIYNVCRTSRSGYHVGVEIRNDGRIYSRTVGAYYTYLCMHFKRSR